MHEFLEELTKAKDAVCVGCGKCCKTAPCAAAVRVYGNGIRDCPALRYDESDKRYFCSLCEIGGEVGRSFRQELSVGSGCCMPLFNTDRDNIPEPPKERTKPFIDKQLRAFFHAMGRQPFGMSGDAVWLLVHSAAHELGEGKEWIKACFSAIKEERSHMSNEFMGEIEDTVNIER